MASEEGRQPAAGRIDEAIRSALADRRQVREPMASVGSQRDQAP
jgi:hypothetical protein